MEKKYKIAGVALLVIIILVAMKKKKKAVKKPVTKPVSNPVTNPVTNPVVTPVTNPVTNPVVTPVTNPVIAAEIKNLADIDVLSPDNIQVGGYTPDNVFIGFDYTGYDPAGKHCQVVGAMLVPFYNNTYFNSIHRYVHEGERFNIIGAKTAKRWEVKDSAGVVGYLDSYCLKLIS